MNYIIVTLHLSLLPYRQTPFMSFNCYSQLWLIFYLSTDSPSLSYKLRLLTIIFILQMTSMLENVRKTVKSRLSAVSWLDDQSRRSMLLKLANLKTEFLPGPDFGNHSYIQAFMQSVRVDPEDFFGNVNRRYFLFLLQSYVNIKQMYHWPVRFDWVELVHYGISHKKSTQLRLEPSKRTKLLLLLLHFPCPRVRVHRLSPETTIIAFSSVFQVLMQN